MLRACSRLRGTIGDVGTAPDADRNADVFAALARSLAELGGVLPTIEHIVARSVDIVPCDWAAAAVARRLGEQPPTTAATTAPDLMAVVADIAGRSVNSPGRLAFENAAMVYSPDVSTDARFEGYSSEIVARTPIRAVLSFGLRLHDEPLGVISFYSATPDGFAQDAQDRARLLADHATIAIDAASSASTADHLRVALESSRTIGAAVGILVERYRVTPEQAFHMLRTASSRTNHKLSRVAEDLLRSASTPPPEPVDEGYGWTAPSA